VYLIQLLPSCNIAIHETVYTCILNLSSISASVLCSIRELSLYGIAVVCMHMHMQGDMINPSLRKAKYTCTQLCYMPQDDDCRMQQFFKNILSHFIL
jgi:hypothetical protein